MCMCFMRVSGNGSSMCANLQLLNYDFFDTMCLKEHQFIDVSKRLTNLTLQYSSIKRKAVGFIRLNMTFIMKFEKS